MKTLFITLLAVITFSACSSIPKPDVNTENTDGLVTLTVGSRQANCTGVGPQKCLIIKKGTDPHWFYLYSGISGFSYEEGYEYQIQVKQIRVTPTAADVSTIGYVYVKELSKEKKNSVGMPGFSVLK